MVDLLSSKEPQKVEVALRAAESLVRARHSDLHEVCVYVCVCLYVCRFIGIDYFAH